MTAPPKTEDDTTEGQRPGWCVHYRRPIRESGNECAAGIPLKTWRAVPMAERPCFLTDDSKPKPGAAFCPYLQEPTPEEIEIYNRASSKQLQQLVAALEAVQSWRKANKGKTASGVVECPICKGRLHVKMNSGNSHIAGKCETEGCVSWIE